MSAKSRKRGDVDPHSEDLRPPDCDLRQRAYRGRRWDAVARAYEHLTQ